MQELMDQQPAVDEAAEDQRMIILNALGLTLARSRQDAISGKSASGIETEWTGDEDHYQGYDDANRNEFVGTTSKPEGGGEVKKDDAEAGSTVFPNITQPYVDAVAARVGDMLLPTDDRNYALKHTPIPEMLPGVFDEQPVAPAVPAPPAQPGMPADQPPAPPVKTEIQQAIEAFAKLKSEAARKAQKAEDHIDDWLQEAQYHSEMRKAIDDAAKLGSGVIKGPVPVKRKASVWTKDETTGTSALVLKEEIKPATFRVDPWNLFPDPACGESIHNGAFIWERDHLTGKKLEDLKGLPGYISSQIDLCVKEGPGKSKEADARVLTQSQSTKDQYEIWYYHGDVKAEELIAAGCDCGDKPKNSYPALMTMVNDHVIRASLNPLDSGEFPYDVIPWKRRPGMPWGMGLARQMRTPQRMVVGATRALMNNAGMAGGPLLTVRRGVVPENGIWEVKPLKFFIEEDDSAGTAASSPVTATIIPMMIAELTSIIQLGMKMAEDVTGMPMLMQGQQGKAPDTVGGMTILNNNANAVLRRIARLFDSCITEPHIRRYYAWLMEYSEDDDEKGDFQIIARGSTALVERDIQNQEMVNILQLCANPIYKKNPAKAMDEYLKSRRFDPAAFDYTEEELKKIAEQKPPEDPRITAAKITAEAAVKREELESQQATDHAAANARLEMQRQQFEAAEADKDRALAQMELEIDQKLQVERLTSDERRDLERQKVLLASVALKLKTQTDLSLAGHRVSLSQGRQALAPPTEPAGQAAPGKAFIQ
ncbi:MAG: hypothetical protein V4730_11765 [Pseudomonadota bacterium]